jgi:sigma-B regulation protein RsbU (phosphoserine phosphatase)
MAMTRTQIKTTALQGLSPSECLDEVNRVLVRDKVSTMFATCIYGILDTRSGEFVYSNAGHNPPFILRSDAAIEPLEMTGGLPLGILVTPKCAENTIRLSPGEGIFMYTDGVTEATNESLDDYTATRLETCLSQNQRNSARDLIDHVGSSLLEFTGAAPQSDDITMLALLRAGR